MLCFPLQVRSILNIPLRNQPPDTVLVTTLFLRTDLLTDDLQLSGSCIHVSLPCSNRSLVANKRTGSTGALKRVLNDVQSGSSMDVHTGQRHG